MALLGLATQAHAIEVCNAPPRFGLSPAAVAIVRTACEEHRQWMQPFIDRQGRLASLRVTEAESGSLADDGVVPWQRVATYWRESGTLDMISSVPGASSCMVPAGNRYTDNDCRAFLVDTPWSAAFVSWVMTHAGIVDFRRSPRHLDYIRAAWRGDGPYSFNDPAIEKPAPGDLLCFIRGRSQVMGYAGLTEALSGHGSMPTESHCDIVVAANVGGDHTLHLIGGNVFNAVTMRQLELDRTGRVVLPVPQALDQDSTEVTSPGHECTPSQEDQCNFNRQDWAVLLKLRAQNTALPVAPGVPAGTSPAPATPYPAQSAQPSTAAPSNTNPAATPTQAPVTGP